MDFYQMLAATHDRLCPRCGGGLALRWQAEQYWLVCAEDASHRMASPDECMSQADGRRLRREAGPKRADESVSKSLEDLGF